MRKTALLALAAVAALAGTSDAAFDWFGGRLSVGGGYGLAKPKLPYTFQDQYEEGRIWTVHGKYFINDNISVVASYADMKPQRRDNGMDIQFRPIIGSLRYNIFRNLPISPYITGGAGISRNRKEVAGQPNIYWTKFAWQAGLGFEFFINQGTSLGAEALYHDIYAEHSSVHQYRPASLVGTVNVYFGDGPGTKRAKSEANSAKEEARRSKEDADRARQEAEAAKNQASSANQQNQMSQAEADAARAREAAAQQAAAAAQQAAATANAGQDEANRRAQEAQAQVQQAQAEVEQIKQMVARKDIAPVNFETGRASLLATSSQTLDRVAEVAKKYPTLHLRVEGHTDNVGADAANLKLSQRRSEAVRDYLVKQGVSTSQITATGLGETQPVASNDTVDGRAQNRRVEFIFSLQ